jgi:hypothetical protein
MAFVVIGCLRRHSEGAVGLAAAIFARWQLVLRRMTWPGGEKMLRWS